MSALSIVSIVFMFAFTSCFTPIIGNAISEGVQPKLEKQCKKTIRKNVEKQIKNGINKADISIMGVKVPNNVYQMSEKMAIKTLRKSGIYDEVASLIANYIIHTISSILCIVITILIIVLVRRKLDMIVKGITVLRVPDMIGGAAVGLAKAMIVIWIVFIVIELTSSLGKLTSSFEFSRHCWKQIQNNPALHLISNNNILKLILKNFFVDIWME